MSSFFLLVACMALLGAAGSLARDAAANPFSDLPLPGPVRSAFYGLMFVSALSIVAVPIYALIVFDMFQFALFVPTSLFVGALLLVPIRNWHYLWSMVYAIAGVVLAVFIVT